MLPRWKLILLYMLSFILATLIYTSAFSFITSVVLQSIEDNSICIPVNYRSMRLIECVFMTCSSYQESDSKVTADGVVGLTRAFLAAGAQCVLVSLWPVPIAASKMFIHAFYSALLNGTKASAALADAMKTVQSSKQFSHPSNWAGMIRPLKPVQYINNSYCGEYSIFNKYSEVNCHFKIIVGSVEYIVGSFKACLLF